MAPRPKGGLLSGKSSIFGSGGSVKRLTFGDILRVKSGGSPDSLNMKDREPARGCRTILTRFGFAKGTRNADRTDGKDGDDGFGHAQSLPLWTWN